MARPVDPRLWRHARSARRYLVLSVALSLATTVCIVVAALALARVLAGVITDPGRRDIDSWTTGLAVFAIAVAVRVAATWWQSRLAHRAGAQVVAELETAVVVAGAQLPPRELERRRTELAVVAGTGLNGLRAYLAGYLPALLLAVLVPPVLLTVIALHDLVSAGIIAVTLPLIPIFMILIGLLTQGKSKETLAATTRLSDQLLDLFAGMPTLRALGRETGSRPGAGGDAAIDTAVGTGESATGRGDAVHGSGVSAADESATDESARTTMAGRVRDLGEALHKRTMSALRIAFLSSMVLEMLATLCVALVAVSIGMRLVYGHMGLYGGLVALILAPEVYLPLRMVGERFHAAQDGMAAADKAFAVLEPDGREQDAGVFAVDAEPLGGSTRVVVGASGSSPGPSRVETREFHGHIEITALSVAARDGAAPDGLSATLSPGAVTVLTGPNGCGKSTVLQAILGLIAPDTGVVRIDGAPVADLDTDSWWSRVAWLPQRPVLVPGTLRDNLELLGAPADPAQLAAACAATGFDTVLDELPDRWDTVVGTGGIGLSLGQRQRLALTRTLAAQRQVLLLDEPTAHLDDASEATVLTALADRARAGATVVVVAHRPTILAIADHVIEVHATQPDGESDSLVAQPDDERDANTSADVPEPSGPAQDSAPGRTSRRTDGDRIGSGGPDTGAAGGTPNPVAGSTACTDHCPDPTPESADNCAARPFESAGRVTGVRGAVGGGAAHGGPSGAAGLPGTTGVSGTAGVVGR
ncbi:ABC transporter ATP-binding protein/permease [Nocardia otitidiscaviarum]|uniref:ABC transporter ATP-binding protein/permease n=1 Tax=Nocardia otitidiscaviarum TaxID=1823 RepID=UPI001895985E|nr:ATP-binding cassette domain-containing protein [Nocardia otitidiscaviarum]MBF6179359.1 ATP-binding cassette domain-containing protein [Nocardia otitidiscaviarum]